MAAPPVLRTAQTFREEHIAAVAADLRRCSRAGFFDGRDTPEWRLYLNHCRIADTVTGALLIFTRDVGMHSSGWFKNPDYERCEHLSISPLNAASIPNLPLGVPDLDRKTMEVDDVRRAWIESPKSRSGIAQGVLHWRVFCDVAWQPITPRSEVYDPAFTEEGWKSASEVIDLTDAGGMTA